MTAAAAVSCARGTTRGVAASNAGRCSDASPIISPAITYSGHSSGRGSSALASSSAAHPARPGSDQRISARRSNRSASTPPYSPNTTSGTSSASPSVPTTSGDPVIRCACTSSATSAACDPRYATVLLAKIARNPAAPRPRSGVTSGTSADQLTFLANITRDGISPNVRRRIIFAPLSACHDPERERATPVMSVSLPSSQAR